MFGDDSFDRLVREFFGENVRSSSGNLDNVNNVNSDSSLYSSNLSSNYERVDSKNGYFIVVNFFEKVNKPDLEITIEDDFDKGEDSWIKGNERALSIVNKAKNNSFLKIKIPKKFAKKDFDYELKNGILEVRFKK